MKLVVNKDRTTIAVGTWGTENENNYEVLNFEFPQELQNYNKRIVYYLDEDRKWDTIVDDRVLISNAVTKYEKVKAYVWLTLGEEITLKYICNGEETGSYYFTYNQNTYYFIMPEVQENDELIFDVATETLKLNNTEVQTSSVGLGTELEFATLINASEDFRTKLFEMNFYENENADGLTPTQEDIDGFNTMLTAMNNKIIEINTVETQIETNETARQEAEVERERRTNEAIENIVDMTEAYNQNATEKTNAFNENASQKTNDFNSNYTQKTNNFNTNATQKTNDFNANAESKMTSFNENATERTTQFNTNADNRVDELNGIAEGIEDMTTAIQFATFEVDNDMHLNIIQAERLKNTNFIYNPDTGRLGVRIYNG